ncbi:MAG: hypothetical protein K1X55_15720 [Chitinophagales bacterium]|nr:hypothetical protein [Chitinophagales bacterium]
MSDISTSIIPILSDYPNRMAKSKEILDWLVSESIINPIMSDCILSASKKGYSVSAGARRIVLNPDELPFDLNVNGLQVVTETTVFDSGEYYLDDLRCPNCMEIIDFNPDFFEEWNNDENELITCPNCSIEADKKYFEPEMPMSNLGFKFWNWPDFTNTFINELEQRLNCKVLIINQRI